MADDPQQDPQSESQADGQDVIEALTEEAAREALRKVVRKKKKYLFQYHWRLEEAVAKLPEVEAILDTAYKELSKIRDEMVLYKRIHLTKRERPLGTDGKEIDVLHKKYSIYEDKLAQWAAYFEKNDMILRDLDRGLVDFPYISNDDEEFLLSWQYGESGILHFFIPDSRGAGRLPITVLPD